jgi:hypothetical protein
MDKEFYYKLKSLKIDDIVYTECGDDYDIVFRSQRIITINLNIYMLYVVDILTHGEKWIDHFWLYENGVYIPYINRKTGNFQKVYYLSML